jgi:hypothetical protein
MKNQYIYELIVEETELGCEARLDEDPATPIRGYGDTPLEAVRSLCEVIREWPISGADRWLATSAGVRLARQFVPGFEPGGKGGSS